MSRLTFWSKVNGLTFSSEKSKSTFGRKFDETDVTTTFRTSVLVGIDINIEAFDPKGKMVISLGLKFKLIIIFLVNLKISQLN